MNIYGDAGWKKGKKGFMPCDLATSYLIIVYKHLCTYTHSHWYINIAYILILLKFLVDVHILK